MPQKHLCDVLCLPGYLGCAPEQRHFVLLVLQRERDVDLIHMRILSICVVLSGLDYQPDTKMNGRIGERVYRYFCSSVKTLYAFKGFTQITR
ncbi:hypothetical protein [Morganella morganii]|uniref:hypothetical protein n=1 Tax=Morganella morganii TaxID=582 RepID=UPI003CC809D2